MQTSASFCIRAAPSPVHKEASRPQALHLAASSRKLHRLTSFTPPAPSQQGQRLIVCAATEVTAELDPWQKARDTYQAGTVFEGTVRGLNRGGVLVDCWGVTGFIPNSMVAPTGRPEEGMTVRALFVEVDELQNRMILSQRQVLQAELLRTLSVGATVEGRISWLEAYGAFVDIALPDGRTASGLIHKSQLSWSVVQVPETVVSIGEWVKCIVLDVDAPRGRVSLSLRQTRPDPLKQSLASILVCPDGTSEVQWVEAEAPLRGLEAAVARLKAAEGVRDVSVGRQATVKGHVSQELELWLGRESEAGKFDLVARSADLVQELAVESTCSKAEMRTLLDTVMKGKPGQDPSQVDTGSG